MTCKNKLIIKQRYKLYSKTKFMKPILSIHQNHIQSPFYKKYFHKIQNFNNLKASPNSMPRRQQLSSIIPNRFYEIDATLKYQHVGANMITGIIQQNNVQTKICIPKDGIQLEEGKHYIFGKCFNSKNGWLYAKKPSQTVIEKEQSASQDKFYSLSEIFDRRDSLANRYVSAQLKVISIEPKQTVTKNDESLILYKLKCFADQLIINIEIWNRQIDTEEVKGKILNFIGFKIKSATHKTITLISAVYSKIEQLSSEVTNPQRFIYRQNFLYKNISSVYEIRTIEQIQNACEEFHKNYSLNLASVNFMEEFTYEGCSKCKKKIQENGCFQCGSNVIKKTYQYLRLTLEDDTGMLECAVFDEEAQLIVKRLTQKSRVAFQIKSNTKKNQETGEPYVSHVVTGIKEFINSQ